MERVVQDCGLCGVKDTEPRHSVWLPDGSVSDVHHACAANVNDPYCSWVMHEAQGYEGSLLTMLTDPKWIARSNRKWNVQPTLWQRLRGIFRRSK